MRPEIRTDKECIDELVAVFFSAFTNKNGVKPDVRALHDLFIAQGMIVKTVGAAPEVYSVRDFIEPRERILNDGTLVDFEEAEVSERTDIFGNIAQRFSTYRKSGVLSGQPFAARGMKSMQLVRTPGGWKLSCVAWDDERDGLVVR